MTCGGDIIGVVIDIGCYNYIGVVNGVVMTT